MKSINGAQSKIINENQRIGEIIMVSVMAQ
jgi:hypothetical protein